jgi:hypothetical protein
MTNEYYFTAQELEEMLSEVAADAYHAKHVAFGAFQHLGDEHTFPHARHFDDGSAEVGGTKDKPRHTITPHGDLGFKVKNNITGKTTTHANKDSAVKHIINDQPKGNSTTSNENYFTAHELEEILEEGRISNKHGHRLDTDAIRALSDFHASNGNDEDAKELKELADKHDKKNEKSMKAKKGSIADPKVKIKTADEHEYLSKHFQERYEGSSDRSTNPYPTATVHDLHDAQRHAVAAFKLRLSKKSRQALDSVKVINKSNGEEETSHLHGKNLENYVDLQPK